MPLIKSISGIRGTIGGLPGENLTPQDIVECTAAFGSWVLETTGCRKIVVGRDGRISGEIVSQLAIQTLRSLGLDVVDLGLSTTPTVEIAVPLEQAGGGIIFTASHNPQEWNALKLLNHKGEFISAADGQAVLDRIHGGQIRYAAVDQLGAYRRDDGYIQQHIDRILALPEVDVPAIKEKKLRIAVDAINSTGALAVPALLKKLGCEVILINGEINGRFAHNPEPLKQHLGQLAHEVQFNRANLGIAVDPDVDRLVFVCDDGDVFGEEYTLVAVADYLLSRRKGPVVSNLSSSRALADIARRHGVEYHASAVGEVNVVAKMKAVNAVIGGEGNGGVIFPDLHYGRDALVGIALFLSHLAHWGRSISLLRRTYPTYHMVKSKIDLAQGIDLDNIYEMLGNRYRNETINREDGMRIDFEDGWVHLRPSNTEPIIRVYAEAGSRMIAENLAHKITHDVMNMP